MTKQGLKLEIEKLSKKHNITFIEACQSMQGAAAMLGNEKIISIIHELKMESIN